MTSLLPPASTAMERRLEESIFRLDHGAIVLTLWDPDQCPPAVLPYLAWALSVDEWDEEWPIEKKRAVVRESREIHRRKGTVAAIRRALASMGHPDAEIMERANCIIRNGTRRRDGTGTRGGLEQWATRRIILKRPVTIDQAWMIKRLIEAVGRNCVHTVAIDFSQATLRRNGMAKRDGSYTRGIVNTSIY